MPLNILFIGGTGQISLSCVRRAVAQGHSVSVFNRAQTEARLPEGVEIVRGEKSDDAAYAALAARGFDAVCQFIAFKPEEVARDIAAFAGKTGQYVFISSASVYEKPPRHHVITEETPAVNPYWPYSQDKIACEDVLRASAGLAWTIVRPSHTVRTRLPSMMEERDLIGHRLLAGKPLLVAGDGSAPWTVTRAEDFARPFVGLLGKPAALGEVFHITSDHAYTWDAIYRTIAAGLGVDARIVHVPTDTLVRYRPAWAGPLSGDKSWTALFDNSKVKGVAGDFTCARDLAEVLAGPIDGFKRRGRDTASGDSDLEALIDRIAAEQSALGTG